MYLRFVLDRRNPHSGVKDGIFEVAYDVRDEGSLSLGEREELEGLLRWFDDNMKEPTRFNRTKSKGWYRRNTKGVCWLKASAVPHVAKMQSLAEILRGQGHEVTMITTSNPGYKVYEDDHQLVAEPFRDMRG